METATKITVADRPASEVWNEGWLKLIQSWNPSSKRRKIPGAAVARYVGARTFGRSRDMMKRVGMNVVTALEEVYRAGMEKIRIDDKTCLSRPIPYKCKCAASSSY